VKLILTGATPLSILIENDYYKMEKNKLTAFLTGRADAEKVELMGKNLIARGLCELRGEFAQAA
jgi:hypothetical protein